MATKRWGRMKIKLLTGLSGIATYWALYHHSLKKTTIILTDTEMRGLMKSYKEQSEARIKSILDNREK